MTRNNSHETSGRRHNIRKGLSVLGSVLTLASVANLALESDASASRSSQTHATIGNVLSGHAAQLLPDISNAYKHRTVIYRSPTTAGGEKNVYGVVGTGEELLVNGVIAVENPNSGNSTLWQPASMYGTGEVVWVKYGGEKTFTEDPLRAHDLRVDRSYHPHMTFNGDEFVAHYNSAHAGTIDNENQIGDTNKVIVGTGSFISTN